MALILSSIAVMVALLCGGSSGFQYWVGDSVWSIPPYPNFYADWSSSHFFHTGDSLVFDFETEFYNLMQVPILDYKNCTANSPIKVLNAGPATILLNEPGIFYFLCNLSNSCDLGQKISIIVHDQNFAPAPAPSPSPSTAPFWSAEPSPGNLNESASPEPATSSSEAPSPADLGLHMNSTSHGRSSRTLIGSSLLSFCFWMILFDGNRF